jgi:hypothetical protein
VKKHEMHVLVMIFAIASFAWLPQLFGQWSDFTSSTNSSKLIAAMNSKPAAQVGSSIPSSMCTSGKDFYVRTATPPTLYGCGSGGWFLVGPPSFVGRPFIAADTYTQSSQANTNFGTQASLLVLTGTTTWVRFDLSQFSSITGDRVASAALLMYARLAGAGGSANVCDAGVAWSELVLTYNNAPTPDCSAGYSVTFGTTGGTFLSADITALAQRWLTTPSTNYGVAIPPSGSVNQTLDSKESTTSSHPFELTLVLR